MSAVPRRSSLVVLILMAAVASGCSDSAATDGDDFHVDAVKNRAEWALPLDDYSAMAVTAQTSSVLNVVMTQCMAAHGIHYPPLEVDDFAANPIVNDVGRRLFDVEIARNLGYGGAPYDAAERRRERVEMERYAVALETPEGAAAEEECLNEQQRRMPPTPDWLNAASNLGNTYEIAQVDQVVLDAIERWRDCLEPLGIEGLPEWPEDMPPRELWEGWKDGPTDENAPIVEWTPPSTEEVELAMADAQCREDSGFAEAFYGAEWDAQVALMAENQDKLERIHASIEAYKQELDQVLAELE